MNINFGDMTIQEAQLVLTGLKKLPMDVVEQFHNKLLAIANEQFLAQQPQVNPEDITITKRAEEEAPKEQAEAA